MIILINSTKVEGIVYMIINEYRLVTSLTSDHVEVGDIVLVIDNTIDIKDNEGNVIGNYSFPKAELIITEVQENYSICISNETTTHNPISTLAGALAEKTVIKPLSVNEKENMGITSKNRTISVGDKVIIKE